MNLIVIICLIALVESRKLTTEENEKRLEVCGLTGKPKVFNGRPTKSSEAPWSVMVMTKKGDEEGGFCTGTILSPRHILSATHCAATGDENEWTHTDVKFPSPKEKCGEHDNLIVTEVAASRVHVSSRNLTLLGRAKYLHMFQFCRVVNKGEYEVQYADDIMIIELADDIEYSENVQPACTARDTIDNEIGTQLDFFGYGDNPPADMPKSPPRTRNEILLLHHKTYVSHMVKDGYQFSMDSRIFATKSVKMNTIACPGDSGGGAIRKIDGRNTVVGVAMRGSCEKMVRGRDGFEIHASVGYNHDNICESTGICNPPRPDSSQFMSWMLVFIVVFIGVLWQEK